MSDDPKIVPIGLPLAAIWNLVCGCGIQGYRLIPCVEHRGGIMKSTKEERAILAEMIEDMVAMNDWDESCGDPACDDCKAAAGWRTIADVLRQCDCE